MRAVGYVRVSSEEQAKEGVSLAAQEAKIRSYCELYGVEITEVVHDAGQSAKSLNRPGLQKALAMLEAGDAEALVIVKLDRLTRSIADWATLIDLYFAKRFALLSVTDQINTCTAAGRMVLNVIVSIGQWEREAIGERTAAALAHLKAQGKHVGSVPFGFELQAGQLVQAASEAEVIVAARRMRAEGATLQAIADELNGRMIPTRRGGCWHPTTVRNILGRAA